MWSIYLNVVIQGVLTGLVYGLALGLSVIFGVVRVRPSETDRMVAIL